MPLPLDSLAGKSRHHRPRVVVLVVLALLGLLAPVVAAAPAQAATLPAGRANYVVATISGPVNAITVRLATYAFRSNGRVGQQSWTWRQNSLAGGGNALRNKPSSGYSTSGCRRACPIRTPLGFQHGATGTASAGTWRMQADGLLAIRWGRSAVELWRLDTSRPGIVGAQQVTSAKSARGWGLGSNAALSSAVSIGQIYASTRIYGPGAENAYGRKTTYPNKGWRSADYQLCGSGLCMQGKGVVAADKRGWFSSYLAANPRADGRKVFWNNQTGVVQQHEAPGSVCISASGGGHTDAMLQALDDSGRFVGVVGVEASLNARKTGQAVVGAFTMVLPSLLSIVR